MLVTMAKIEMIGPKKYFDNAIALLQQLGTLDIEDLSKKEDDLLLRKMDIDPQVLESRNNLRNLLVRLNGVISVYEPLVANKITLEDKKVWEKDNSYLTKQAEGILKKVEEKTRELVSKKKHLELELASLQRYHQVLRKVYPLAQKIMPTQDAETVAFVLEGEYADTVNAIDKEIGKLTENNFELISTPIDEDTTAAIVVFNKKYSRKVHKFLSNSVKEIEAPSDVKDLSIDKVLVQIEDKQKSYPQEIAKIEKQLKPLADEWYSKSKVISNALHNKAEQIEAMPSFGQTDYTFVLHAWLPVKELKDLKKQISERWGQKIVIRQLELDHHDLEKAPVAIDNPGWASPFEIFMKIFQPPRYGTLDPTIFVALFFPIFFGFIVGDIGYGLVVLTTVTLLRLKFMKSKGDMVDATTRIFQYAAIASIVFGIFYLEFFGTVIEKMLGHQGIEEITVHFGILKWPYLRDPSIKNRLQEFIFVSLYIGFAHLFTSFIMGIINARKEMAYKHMWEKVGMLGFLIAVGVFFTGWLIRGIPSGPETVPISVIAVLSVGLAVYGGGPMALMEGTFGVIGNLASYLRLMSLGFAGAILAGVANDFAAGSFIGIFLAIFLHVINVIVHTVSPAIHSFRLNFLEGFGKFYEEGGREYKPFFARR